MARLSSSTVNDAGTKNYVWYNYDYMGNRLSLNATQTTYNYNQANNELNSYTITNGPSVSYSYNPDGSLHTKSITLGTTTTTSTYSWDALGDLLKVANNSGIQGSYGYDGLGRMVKATEGSATIFYAYTGTETLAQQIPSGLATDYIYAGGMRVAKATAGTVNYYHTDALGSTRLVTDSSGHIVFADNYQPFGQDNGRPVGSETYKFTGRPVSQTTGL